MSDRHAISPYPIRMPSDLREKLESSSAAGKRSLHAEIVARLQSSFDGGSGEQVAALKKDLELERLRNQKERFDALGAKLVAVQLAALVDPVSMTRHPQLAQAASTLQEQKRELLLDMLEHTIVGIAGIPDVIQRSIDAGNTKMAAESDKSTKVSNVLVAMAKTSRSVQDVLNTVDDGVLLELFDRPKIKAALAVHRESDSIKSKPRSRHSSKPKP